MINGRARDIDEGLSDRLIKSGHDLSACHFGDLTSRTRWKIKLIKGEIVQEIRRCRCLERQLNETFPMVSLLLN